MNQGETNARPLTSEDVRKVARLSRLAIGDDQIEQYRAQLSGVLTLMDKLREVDVSGVEPMSHPGDQCNRLAEDRPCESTSMLSPDALLAMAPETMDHFVKIPKVIGDDGGA